MHLRSIVLAAIWRVRSHKTLCVATTIGLSAASPAASEVAGLLDSAGAFAGALLQLTNPANRVNRAMERREERKFIPLLLNSFSALKSDNHYQSVVMLEVPPGTVNDREGGVISTTIQRNKFCVSLKY
jgi:hypothetical protein